MQQKQTGIVKTEKNEIYAKCIEIRKNKKVKNVQLKAYELHQKTHEAVNQSFTKLLCAVCSV